MESAINSGLETIGLPATIRGKVNSWKSTEDTSSDKVSSCDGNYEVIEYDLMESEDDDDFLQEISIHKDSPAAAALRANASVKVPAVSKAARAVHLQTVRRAVRLGTHSITRKGKPPRAPPPNHQTYIGTGGVDDPEIKEEQEGDSADEDLSEDADTKRAALPPQIPALGEEDEGDDEESFGTDYEVDGGDGGGEEIVEAEKLDPPARKAERLESTHAMRLESSSAIHSESMIGAVSDQSDTPFAQAPSENQQMTLSEAESMHFLRDSIAPGTVEAGRKVLGSVDPHDLLRKSRWRRKKNPKIKKSYVKGKVIDGEHELYTLSIAVMIGVRTSISRTNTELNGGPEKRFVRMQDFHTTEKYEFRPKGGGPLPPHQLAHTFKFKDYSPVVFAYLRRLYGVNEFDFLLSVCGNANFIEFISNAKSGQFFFYSSDGRYMIKTMTNTESKFLRRILPDYFRHCCDNPNTMMTRFLGMYRVKLYHLRRNVKFVIMNSVYYTDKYLQTFYDLKGSVIGRDAKPGQAVLKDNDLRQVLPEGALALPPRERIAVRKQLDSDLDFLTSMGIMDYSMLVGVHHVPAFEGRTNNAATISFRRKKSTRRPTSGNTTDDSDTDNMVDIVPKSPIKRNRSEPPPDILEDDENSYLIGSESRCSPPMESLNSETEQKKQQTVEKLFWPFHHLYDIQGHRRWLPLPQEENGGVKINGFNIPAFTKPLADRKDGGLEMDTTGLHLPLKQPDGLLYEGKIFYMGVIDVLQEYNTRKSIESKYRYLRSALPNAASCVPPRDYADRFLEFFDQFAKRDMSAKETGEQGVEVSEREC